MSGSSLGLYATSIGASEGDAGVLAGPARPIRTDEWEVRTPWVLRQVERGFPDEVAGGVGRHDTAVLYDLPTKGWEVVLRPPTLLYHLFGAEQAFALEWWSLFALQLLGVYALLVTLTGRAGLSALGAALMTFSPVSQWWTTPATYTTVGYGCLAAAFALRACRVPGTRARVGWSVAGGLALAAFLATLYPPWQIGTALVVVPVAGAALWAQVRPAADRRRVLRGLAVVAAVTASVGGGLFGAFLVDHEEAVSALSDTVYPGHREAAEGGGTPVAVAFGAAFDSFSSADPYLVVNGTNQSESSSALPLLVPAAVGALALLVRRRWGHSRVSAPLAACLVAGAVVTAWMLVPLPSAAGRPLLLTRVPGSRMVVPFGLAGILALTLLVAHLRERVARLAWWEVAAGAGLFAGALWWAALRYTVDYEPVDLRVAAGLAVVAVAGVALALTRRPVIGLAVLAAFGLWQASLVNPLQDGVGPLTTSALRMEIDNLRGQAPAGAGWIAFGDDHTVRGTLAASGVNNLSGVSPYPDEADWRELDPDRANRDLWNRYAHVYFVAGPEGSDPEFSLRSADVLEVTVDPCSPALDRLGVAFVVTAGAEPERCARPVARVRHGRTQLTVYRY